MKIKIEKCNIVTCSHCKNATLVKTSLVGTKKYICPKFPRIHKAIKGVNCGAFSCNYSFNFSECDDCKQKVLKR